MNTFVYLDQIPVDNRFSIRRLFHVLFGCHAESWRATQLSTGDIYTYCRCGYKMRWVSPATPHDLPWLKVAK